MKKYCFLLVVFTLMINLSICQAVEILNHDFEADTFEDNGWDTTEVVDWTLSTGNWGNPGHYAWGGGGAGGTEDINSGRILMDTGHAIQAGEIITMTFDIRDLTPNVEFESALLAGLGYVDGTGEHMLGTIEYLDADIPYGWNAGLGILVVASTPEAVGNNLYVGFSGGPSSHNGTSAQRIGIDNIIIDASINNTARLVAPADGADMIEVDSTLEWMPPLAFEPTDTVLYLRAGDPNFSETAGNIVNGVSVTSPYAPTLTTGNTYFWRIDTSDGTTTYEGDTWSFMSVPSIPIIETQPASATVDSGQDVILEVAGLNIVSYQWYKNDEMLSGETGATLTVSSVDLDDEGYYYCVVSNGIPAEDLTSDAAVIITKRLVSHWSFDGDLTDPISGFDGVYTDPNEFNTPPTVVYDDDGISGSSIRLEADDFHVLIADTEELFNFYTEGFTVNAWVKTTGTSSYSGIVSKRTLEPSVIGWTMNRNGSVAYIQTNPGGNYSGSTIVNDDQWHMVTMQYDKAAGKLRLYTDGMLEAETGGSIDSLSPGDAPLIIGVTTSGITSPWEGLIDEVQIYSYPLADFDIADMYVAVVADADICVNQTGLEFDVSGPDDQPDCAVDLFDFAKFAATWLNCNRVAGDASDLADCY